MNSERKAKLAEWVQEQAENLVPGTNTVPALRLLAGDASFRKYYRFSLGTKDYIAVDSPPDKEENEAFVHVAEALARAGTKVPDILAYDKVRGFFILSDFGDTLLAHVIDDDNVSRLYEQALTELLTIQKCHDFQSWQLPDYSHGLLAQECALFRVWLVEKFCAIDMGGERQQQLSTCFDALIDAAAEQPKVCTHRDYHSRNLMLLENGALGVIDFQSAVRGPITYDVVSLLRDCYLVWPTDRVREWADAYLQQAISQGLFPEACKPHWQRWFDWMGIQRHLKAAGIFARLALRDQKRQYLHDIPRTLNYVIEVGKGYAEMQWLVDFIDQQVLPAYVKVYEPSPQPLSLKGEGL